MIESLFPPAFVPIPAHQTYRLVPKCEAKMGPAHRYPVHSMRETLTTTALENGAALKDVRRSAWRCQPSATTLFGRHSFNPEKAANFFATY